MTKLLVVCLGVILSWPASEAFNMADRIGDPNGPGTRGAYFKFSTTAGNYTIRYDGFVEVYTYNDINHKRKRVFFLKTVGRGRLERVYFLEHEGDLLLQYDVIGQGSYFTRLEQTQRKARWFTALNKTSPEAPVVNGDVVIAGDTEIRKADGRIVRQD